MNAPFDIHKYSRDEKLRIMETIWHDLSANPLYDVPSPEWHGDCLKETEDRYKSGRESALDWETVKTELRKRYE